MIFVNKQVNEDDFVSLLQSTKQNIEHGYSKSIPKNMNGNAFEDVVYNQMVLSSANTDFSGHIEQTGAHGFPDIVARKLYGVEVKMTIGDKWVSTGNSVLESTRIDGIETIYMFFGKFGKNFGVKYRKYQECLYEVGVTHSPRYKIDMDLPAGQSIFDKLGVAYDDFRKESNPIKRLKDYYRKQLKDGQELWWIDAVSEQQSVSPIIQSLTLLDRNVRNKFTNECYILFPEMFGRNGQTKFERAAAYLITNYNAVCASLRDNFTAGGKETILVDRSKEVVSQMVYRFYNRAKELEKIMYEIPLEKLAYYWGVKLTRNDNRFHKWYELLSNSFGSDDIVDIFLAGVKNGKN